MSCIRSGKLLLVQRGSKLINSILLFACCQGLLLYCAGWTVYQTVPHTSEGWRDYQSLFENRTFVQLALSLLVRLSVSLHNKSALP